MIKTPEYLGKAEILTSPTVVVSQPTTITIRFTVGKYGFDERGRIKIAWRSISDWEKPQFTDPKEFGYTTVKLHAKSKVTKMVLSASEHHRPFRNATLVTCQNGGLQEGDYFDITFGDTSQGSLGIRPQSFVESRHQFVILVDPFQIAKYHELDRLEMSVINGPMNEVQIVAPSYVNHGEDFAYTVRVLDEWGNPCVDFVGDLKVTAESADGKYSVVENVHIGKGDKGFKKISGNSISDEGTYYFRVTYPENGLTAVSNPCICEDNRPYNLYWGDMHAQTSLTIGTGSLDEYYSFAKGPGAVDFTGWQGNDFEITPEKWEEVRAKTKEYNKEGEFLTYLGYEWSGVESGGGDHNVWYLDDSETYHASSHWEVDDEVPADKRCDRFPISAIFDEYRNRDDVLIIPHIGGRPANLDFYDAEKIQCIEIHSHHGTFEWFAREAMERKLKVGFVASSDDHSCRPGLSYAMQNAENEKVLVNTGMSKTSFDTKSGLVGVYAKELTKKAIMDAIKARRCFAATYNRMIVDVRVNDAFIGEEIACDAPPTIKAKVVGHEPIDHVDLYRGNTLVHSVYNYKIDPAARTKKVKVIWSGVRIKGRSKSARWDGTLCIDKGRIISAEGVGLDTFQHGLTSQSSQVISWKSTTAGDYDGFLLEIENGEDATLSFSTALADFNVKLSELTTQPIVFDGGGLNLQVEVALSGDVNGETFAEQCQVELDIVDENYKEGFGAYWVKAVQTNGQIVYSSPIFLK